MASGSMRHSRHCGSRAGRPGRIGAVAAALVLTACATTVGGGAEAPGASGTPSAPPSFVVYPPPGTAALASNPMCQLARDTAIPAAKRSVAANACNGLLSRATQPVTKPVLPQASPSASPAADLPAPPCWPSDLGSRYFGGGDGGQTAMGGIAIWNRGPRTCRVAGRVEIAAISPGGAADTAVVGNRPLPPVDANLPPNTPAYEDAAGLDGYLDALLAAPQFNSAPSCTRFSGPATFVLSIGSLSFRTPNNDPSAAQNTVLKGCDGRILLEGLEAPTAE